MMAPVTSTTNSSVRQSVPGKVTLVALPPCRVCGEKASGFHYGVNTCEACKGFFRRCLVRKVPNKCSGKQMCAIGPGKKHALCATCRYKKCLAVGMSKTAIKTGRYTSEKKSKNLEEIRQMGLKDEFGEEPVEMRVPCPKNIKRTAEQTRCDALETLVERVTVAHLAQTPHSNEFKQAFNRKEMEFHERRFQNGRLKKYNTNLMLDVELDFDQQRELLQVMLPGMEDNIRRFITFAKSIPGFKDLPTDDQIIIIKNSRSFADLIMWSHLLNGDTNTFYSPHHHDFITLEDYKTLFPQSSTHIDRVCQLILQLQSLDLTPQEQAITAALAIMNEPVTISHVGWMSCLQSVDDLADALTMLVEKSSDEPAIKIANIVRILTELKATMGENISFMEQSILINYPGVVDPNAHKLWLEVTGLTDKVTKQPTSTPVSEVERLCNE